MNSKKTQDYILLVLNCEKYRNKALIQKETWLPTLPESVPYFHVIGNTEMEDEFHFDETERILWVKTKDDYVSLPKKVIAAYNAVQETYNFKYILKTDDDQQLIKPKFFNTLIPLLNSSKLKPHYIGKVIKNDVPYLSEYYRIHPELPRDMVVKGGEYCNGRFYGLSSEAVTQLLTKRDSIEKEYLEDYAIGLNLHKFFKSNILSIDNDTIFKDQE